MKVELVPHLLTPAAAVRKVEVEIVTDDWSDVLLRYSVETSGCLKIPQSKSPARTDDLWRSTCFELFIRDPAQASYVEFNFSPSSEWAAYTFDDYRAGMNPFGLTVPPHIEAVRTDSYTLDVNVDLSDFSNMDLQVALAAVIEEIDGTKSYWALRHPPGKPDFHHPDCFALEIPALRAP